MNRTGDDAEPSASKIPERFFGPVEDEVYELIGKVVAMGAFLESRLFDLLCALGDKSQHTYAGEPLSELVRLVKKHLDRADADLRSRIESSLDEAETLIALRNAAAHSVWPEATLERMHGWYPKRGKDKTPADWIRWVETSGHELRDAIGATVELTDVLDRLTQEAHGSPEIQAHKRGL